MQFAAFFLEVIVDGERFQGSRGQLDPHPLDELEGVLSREAPGGESGGEEAHVDRGEGNGIHGRDGGLPEVAEDMLSGALGLRVVAALDLVVVGPGAVLPGICLRSDPRHTPVIGGLLD